MSTLDPEGPVVGYRQIGHCIYCGSKKQLSREHVVPRGLGGKNAPDGAHRAAVLGRASCEACRVITWQVETEVQREAFGHLRTRLGMTLTPPKDRVSGMLVDSNNELTWVEGPPDLFPAMIVLPIFDTAPRILADNPLQNRWIRDWFHQPLDTSSRDLPLPDGIKYAGKEIGFDAKPFERMIAKIGLGAAILKLGPDYFGSIVGGLYR